MFKKIVCCRESSCDDVTKKIHALGVSQPLSAATWQLLIDPCMVTIVAEVGALLGLNTRIFLH